jgi:hypothetical protein
LGLAGGQSADKFAAAESIGGSQLDALCDVRELNRSRMQLGSDR